MTQNFPRYGGSTGKQRLVISFILGYFQQNFMKTKKNLHFVSFLPIVGRTNFLKENPFSSLFSVSRFLLPCKSSEKINAEIPRKVNTDWHGHAVQKRKYKTSSAIVYLSMLKDGNCHPEGQNNVSLLNFSGTKKRRMKDCVKLCTNDKDPDYIKFMSGQIT